MTTTKEKYNHWKIVKFLKEHGEYEKYINEKVVLLNIKGFEYFPKEICYLKGLERLGIENNQITNIPKEISHLKELERLGLGQNQITHIPKEISYLKELRSLDLDHNQITHIPKEIYYLKGLKTLDLDRNQIIRIPKEISYLKNNLKKLWIENNPIQQTKEEIQELLPNTKIWI